MCKGRYESAFPSTRESRRTMKTRRELRGGRRALVCMIERLEFKGEEIELSGDCGGQGDEVNS